VEDQIARAIAARIGPELVRAEIALIDVGATRIPTPGHSTGRGAGVISLKGWSEETLEQATTQLRQATTLDPDFAAAAVTEARAEAERAVTIDHDTSVSNGVVGSRSRPLGSCVAR
jgi:adenylate cyclase